MRLRSSAMVAVFLLAVVAACGDDSGGPPLRFEHHDLDDGRAGDHHNRARHHHNHTRYHRRHHGSRNYDDHRARARTGAVPSRRDRVCALRR